MKPAFPIFILDLAPILKGGTPAEAFRITLDLARHAEKWGYRRYWLAEHHGMLGVASAATWCNRVGRKRLPAGSQNNRLLQSRRSTPTDRCTRRGRNSVPFVCLAPSKIPITTYELKDQSSR
jgi:hypothetical protein